MMGIISNLGAMDGIVGVDIPREETEERQEF